MTDARKPLVGHFDAKKHAYRQTQDGVVISFVVDPADIEPEFATAPLGTCLKIGYAEYDPETGQPIEAPPSPQAAGGHARANSLSPERRREIAAKAANTRWHDAKEAPKREKPKRQHGLSEECAMHCQRRDFQDWIGATDEVSADMGVKNRLGIKSKRELDTDPEAAERWKSMEASFRYRDTPAMERME